MAHHMMIGCDLHDRSMVLALGLDDAEPTEATYPNTRDGRDRMIAALHQQAHAAAAETITLVYEASNLGYSLHDELVAQGITCHIVAPTKLPTSPHHRRNKTDAKDALRLLELLRGHLLAGNPLPASWVPPPATRDDRELLRRRLDTAGKLRLVKNQIRALLKRQTLELAELGRGAWGPAFEIQLQALTEDTVRLGPGTRVALASLLRQKAALDQEIQILDKEIRKLARNERHAAPMKALSCLEGVGILTALVFLTEIGEPKRFANRRQLAAYLGLVPSAYESGERSDRKGHITRQGPGRVRGLLCQAVWTRIRRVPAVYNEFRRQTRGLPRRKKIVVVGLMRRLAIVMWHTVQPPQDANAPGDPR